MAKPPPPVGTIVKGWRYKGGDARQDASWEKVTSAGGGDPGPLKSGTPMGSFIPNAPRIFDTMARGFASGAAQGGSNEFSAGMESIPSLVTRGPRIARQEFDARLAAQDTRDRADMRDLPTVRVPMQMLGAITTGSRFGVPNATTRGGRIVQGVALGGGMGAAQGFLGTDGSLEDRLKGAGVGLLLGSGMGAAFGGLGKPPPQRAQGAPVRPVTATGARKPSAAIKPPPRAPVKPPPARTSTPRKVRSVDVLASRAGPLSAEAMARRAAEFRAAGLNPALVDVLDDSGIGVVRAAASRLTPAREAVRQFQEGRAQDLPSQIGRISRNAFTSDTRTPMQIQSFMEETRKAAGDRAFGAVRSERFQLNPDAVLALRSPDGRAAIDAAGRMSLNSLDPAERAIGAELSRLGPAMLDDPTTPITVGMAQQISKSLLDAGDTSYQGGSRRAGSLLTGLGRAIRDDARTKIPAYGQALDEYSAQSRLMDAATLGEDILKRNTDEFVSAAGRLSPDEMALARATAPRAIERQAGEGIGSAPGVARRLAYAPEQQARTAALLGPDDALRFQNSIGLAERFSNNAASIAPRIGSQTAPRATDSINLAGAVDTGRKAMRGDYIGIAMDWYKSRGVSDEVAQELTNLAIDPEMLDQTLAYIAERYGPEASTAVSDGIRAGAIRLPVGMMQAGQSASQEQ